MAKFCPECGGPLEERAKFCPNCGYRLSDADAAPQPEAPSSPAPQPEPQAAPFSAPPTPEPQEAPPSPPPIGETVVLDQFRNQYEAQQSYQQYNQQQAQPGGWSPVPPQSPQGYGQSYGGPNYQGYSPAPSVQAPPKKKSNTGLIIAIVAVILAALAAVACFVWPGFLKKQDTPPQPTPSAPASTEQTPATTASVTQAPDTEPSSPPETLPPSGENALADVDEDDPYLQNYLWALGKGMLPDGYVNAGDDLTWADATWLLWMAGGAEAPERTDCPYTDVPEDAPYRDAVLWALDVGLLSETDDGLFEPDELMSRADAVTFCYFAVPDDGSGLPRAYGDVVEDDWCYDAVNWAFDAGVTERDARLCFDPWEDATRGDYLVFLSRTADSSLALWPEDPEALSLSDYGLAPNVELGGTVSFQAWPKDSSDTQTLTMTVEDYRVLEPDEDHPAREGYEWREVVLYLDHGDEEAAGYGYSLYCDLVDMDFPEAYMENKWYGGGEEPCFTFYDGAIWDIWEDDLEAEELDDALFRVRQRVQVPVGYDRLCVIVYSENSESGADYLFDYCGEGSSAVFRMN